MDNIYWVNNFKGKAKGGYFVRNDLFKFFQKLKEKGLNPVGIKIEDDWNLEIIISEEE